MYLRVSTKPLPNDAKNSLPVDVRRSKTLLLKLPTFYFYKRFDHVTSYDRPRYFETLNSFLFYLSLRLLRSKRFESSELLRAFPSPVIPFFFALVPATFSTNSRGNACYAG